MHRKQLLTSSALIFLTTIAVATSPECKNDGLQRFRRENECLIPQPLDLEHAPFKAPLMLTSDVLKVSKATKLISPSAGINAHEVNFLCQLIIQAQNLHPAIAEYFNTIFKFLPNFKFKLVTHEQFKKAFESRPHNKKGATSATSGSFYDPWEHAIYIKADLSRPDEIVNIMLHEMRHAYWHTLHLLHGTHGFDNYFTPTERDAVNDLLNRGKKNIKDFRILLTKEINKQLKEGTTEAEWLKTLRSQFSQQIRNYCKQDTTCYGAVELDIPENKNLKTILENEYTIVGYPEPVKFYPITHEIIGNKVKLYLIPVDPLWSLVRTLQRIEEVVEGYDSNARLYEHDAYLFQTIPYPLIKEFFGDYLRFISTLVPAHSQILNSMDYLLENPGFIRKSDNQAKLGLLNRIRFYLETTKDPQKIQQCLDAATELMHSKAFKSDALLLASSASFRLKKYDETAQYSYRARKLDKPRKLHHNDEENDYIFALSSYQAGFYKDSAKACKRIVLTTNNERHKADCNAVLAEIRRLRVK